MSITLNGRVYTTALLAGTDGRDYARPEAITGSGAILWDFFFTDLVAQMSVASSIQGVAPGALYGFLRSNGSAWARVSGITPSTDLNAAVPYTKGGTGLTTLGSANGLLRTNAGVTAIEWAAAAGASYAIISGGAGGALTVNAWTKRELVTEDYDPSGIVSIASSVFTLQAGTYLVNASCVAQANTSGSSRQQIRIRNTSDSTTDARGLSEYSSTLASYSTYVTSCVTTIQGVLTPASAKTYELQAYSGNSAGTATGSTMTLIKIA